MLLSTLRFLFGPRPSATRRSSQTARPTCLRLEALEDRLVPTTLHVGTKPGEYASINAALAQATPGSTVMVDPGVYPEQVKITTDRVKLVAGNSCSLTKILAPSGASGSLVDIAAKSVLLEGFTVDGGGNSAGLIDSAVRVEDGASATIRDNHITHLFLGSNNQTGFGIRVGQDTTVLVTSATIQDNVIDGYQKGGILVDGAGSSAIISDNVVRGAGPTGLVAQNGIQISDGAAAEVTDNCVSDNIYTGSDFLSTGILVFNDSAKVEVEENVVTHNESGIVLDTVQGTEVTENVLTCNTLDGIDSFTATSVYFADNVASGNGGYGIFLFDSSNNTVHDNLVSCNADNGIYLLQSTSNTLRDNVVFANGGTGILLESSDRNTLSDNSVKCNHGDGIGLTASSFNTLQKNDIDHNGGAALRIDAQSHDNKIVKDRDSDDDRCRDSDDDRRRDSDDDRRRDSDHDRCRDR